MSLAAVVEHGSFTRAANALGVSQAAVSQQVRDLERSCGLPLILQHGRSLAATALGEELATIGRHISLEAARAVKSIAEHVAGHKGHLTVGASMTIGVYLVPRMLARLQKEHPAIHVQIEIANTEDIAQATFDGIVDIGSWRAPLDVQNCSQPPSREMDYDALRRPGIHCETVPLTSKNWQQRR